MRLVLSAHLPMSYVSIMPCLDHDQIYMCTNNRWDFVKFDHMTIIYYQAHIIGEGELSLFYNDQYPLFSYAKNDIGGGGSPLTISSCEQEKFQLGSEEFNPCFEV